MTDQSIPRVGTRAKCRHCGEEIIFESWFRDGRGPNPPIWAHTEGPRTCGTRPKGWRRDRWPFADPEPAEADSHVCGNCEGVDPNTCLTNPDRPVIPECLNDTCAMGCTTECRAVINAAWRRLNPAAAERTDREHCGESRPHPAHKGMRGRVVFRCPGHEPTPPALRDRYAAAIYEYNNPGHRWADAHPDDLICYGADADAALAVRDRELEQLRTELERVRAALDSFDGRGVLGNPNCWPIPTASEVLDAVRAALQEQS